MRIIENKLSAKKKIIIAINVLTFAFVLFFFPKGYGFWGIWGINIFSLCFVAFNIVNVFKSASQIKSESFDAEKEEYSEILNSIFVLFGFIVVSIVANNMIKVS